MRNLLAVIVLLIWLALGCKMCSDHQACCAMADGDNMESSASKTVSSAATAATAATKAIASPEDCNSGVICMQDNSYQASYSGGFGNFIDSLKATLQDGQKLNITGYYTPSEQSQYKGSMDNLGVHRADIIRRKIAASLSSDRVALIGRQVVGRELGLNDKISFDIIKAAKAAAPKVESSTSIYFPYNSTQKLSAGEIDTYLTQVANRVKGSGESVRLEGHTDSAGPSDGNQRLGLSRAKIIKQNLVSKGVSSAKISVSSMGETQPVATNATSAGRALNRRTELTIIK